MLMSVIQPIVETIKNVVRYLIQSQQTDFKDSSPVTALLKFYAMSSVVNQTAMGYHLSRKVCQDVVSILTFYTSSGVWKEMVRDVIKYTSSAPHTFIPGLEIMSQLLPLPLPMQVQAPGAGKQLYKSSPMYSTLDLYFGDQI